MSLSNTETSFHFLQGGGEMGELTRNFNWNETLLGSPEQWPQSLRTTLSILLNSKFPMFLFWGEHQLCFYNDAYRPSLGNDGKHPIALGRPGKEVWPEIWPVIKPLIDQVLAGGEASWSEDQLIPIYRNGKLEDVYWTFSYSPVNDETGRPAGVFVTCSETTKTVETLRQLRLSRQRFENLVREATIGVIILTGKEMRIAIVNQAYGTLINRTPADLLGYPLFNIIPETEAVFRPMLDNVRLTGEPLYLYDYPYFVYVNGEKKEGFLNTVYQPYKETDGSITGVMAICHDVTEQVTARQKLEKSEQYFRQLTDTVPAIIWITLPDGYCTYLNKNWYEYTGQTHQQAEGFGWLTAIHPEDSEMAGKVFLEANNKQTVFKLLYRLRNKEGEYRWAIDSGSPKFSKDGVYEGMIGTVIDVHEQKEAEEKIRQSESRFRSLIATAPVAIGLLTSRDLVIETPNQIFIDIVGKGDGIIGKPLREAMPELITEGQPFLKILDDVFTSGKMFQTSGTQVKIVQQGVLKHNYYDFSYTPLQDADGKTYAILDIAVDVTEEVLARQQIAEAEERTRMAVEAAELGTYEVNMLTNDIIASPRFNEIFSLGENSERKSYIDTLHPDDLMAREQAHEQAGKTGSLDYTARIIKSAGTIHWVRVRGKVVSDNDGRPVRLLGIAQDITEQVELERQKDSFLGIASHELKTPVTSIKAYTQLMQKMFVRDGDTKNAALVAKMDHQANRLNSLITDLLDVTKINNGKLQFNITEFYFDRMVMDVIEDIQRTSPEHIIKKQLNFAGTVSGDRERISQVVINLLTNAIKYSPQANEIIVHTKNNGNEVQLCVQDFGIGISQNKQDKVFEQFYRVSGTREHTFPGLGLGLYISSEIVKRMDGRIWVNSVEGKGSTFCFAIPVMRK